MSHPHPTLLGAGLAVLGLFPADPVGPEPGPSLQDRLEPFELVLQAELVVEGVIVDFAPRHPAGADGGANAVPATASPPLLELELGEVLAGFAPGGAGSTLRVTQPVAEDLAARYAAYERGQRALFFLRRSPDANAATSAPWTLLGRADEGEWPLVRHPTSASDSASGAEFVLFRGPGLDGLAPRSAQAFGHHYFGYRATLDEVRALVLGLRGCFAWEPRPTWELPRALLAPRLEFMPRDLRRTCSEAALSDLRAESPLIRAVLDGSRAVKALRERGDA